MNSKPLKLGVLLLAPLVTACAQNSNRLIGPPIPAPLNHRQAGEVAAQHAGGDARVSLVDDLDDGHLFGVTSPAGRDGAFRESSLLFVHDDGSVHRWPGR